MLAGLGLVDLLALIVISIAGVDLGPDGAATMLLAGFSFIVFGVFVWFVVWSFVKPVRPKPVRSAASAPRVAVKSDISVFVTAAGRRSEEDVQFDKVFLDGFGRMLDKHFYVRVAGVSRLNADGSSRQALIRRCEPFDRVCLRREPKNPVDPNAVAVLNAAGEQLGYLSRETAVQVAGDYDGAGRIWLGVVRMRTEPDGEIPAGLVLCLYRLSEEFVRAEIACTEKAGTDAIGAMIRARVATEFMERPKR